MAEKRNASTFPCLGFEKNGPSHFRLLVFAVCNCLWDESRSIWRSAKSKVCVRIDMTVFRFPIMQRSSSRATGDVPDWWPGLKPS